MTGRAILVLLQEEPTAASDLPRPPADVVGGDWSPWLLAAAAVLVLALAAAAIVAVRRWVEGRGDGEAALGRGLSPREAALRELERIRDEGGHRNGRVVDFYASSTDALRRFAESVEPDWSTALTSRELLARMGDRWGGEAMGQLPTAVARAERVKFGGERPAPETAEADWRRIRDWVQTATERP